MYRKRNTFQSRLERGAYLSPEDFETFLRVAMDELDDILYHFEALEIVDASHEDASVQRRKWKRARLN